MPPSGPTLWSSNNSIQLSSSNDYQEHTKGSSDSKPSMMNNNHDNDVIGSLGKVLSSVNLAGEASSHGSVGGPPGGYGTVGSNPGSWSGLNPSAPAVAAPAPATAGLSYNFLNNNNGGASRPAPVPKTNNADDSLQNILYDSGIYEKEEVIHRRASTGPGITSSHNSGQSSPLSASDRPSERKPSIDIFLSQSPSKTLGEDAFKVHMHRTISNPSLAGLGGGSTGGGYHTNQHTGLGGKPLASTAPSSRSESPQTIRPGTAGNSPYQNSNNGRQMYPSQFTSSSMNPQSNTYTPGVNQQQQSQQQQHGGGLHAQLQQQQSNISSQYSTSSNTIPGLVNNGNNTAQQQQQVQQPQVQQQQYVSMPVAQQQPQVFYMAVPGPDGKQVLQAVQMVQMPGQTGTLMMPMAQPAPASNQGQDAQGQSMMLMQQPMQGAANNGMNTVYGNDQGNNMGGVGSNNQYSQYGNPMQQQQQGGYDANAMNRGYQKSSMVDNLGVGRNQFPNDGSVDPSQVPAGSLSMLYSSPQRPPLRALLGNVRRLSRDQVGCRLLQQALDEDGPSAATAILNEGLTFWAEAMVDPFGNYLFQKILERITPEERVTLVSSVSTRLVNASLNLHGTRSVQKIVEVCAIDEEKDEEDSSDEKEEENKKEEEEETKAKSKKGKKKKDTAAKILTDALKPSAARLCIDSHGNHAIQRILLKLPYQYTQFIFDAVAASVEDVARHRHGCCVIQRCLDSRHSAARTHLVSRIVEKSLELMQDAYGNYVVQYVLDVCGDDEVHAICESVIGKVCLLAIQKFSSNVMEKCLERCTDRVREEYLNELNDSDRIRELMMDPFGNYVVQRALSVSTHAQAIRLVETMKPHLSSANGGGGIRNTAGGRRILGKICRRFPNFVLEGETFEDYDLNQVLARGSPHGNYNPGGGGRRQNHQQFGMHPQHPGPSPNHRRNGGRGRGGHHQHHHQQHTIPQYQQQVGHHVNVQQPDMSVMQPAYHQPATGGTPYLFPQNM